MEKEIKLIIVFVLTILLSSIFIDSILALESGKELHKSKKWNDFKSKYGADWKISVNKFTGTPHKIFGSESSLSLDKNFYSLTKKEKNTKVKNFISKNKELLKADVNNLIGGGGV